MHSSKQNELVRQALERVLESEGFAKAPQLSRFLDYVVRKTLDGNAHKIKGYTIGVEALGRNTDFDPQTDPAVRVMAGRLRQTLDNYNREVGVTQPALISISKAATFRFSAFRVRRLRMTTRISIQRLPRWPRLLGLASGRCCGACYRFSEFC